MAITIDDPAAVRGRTLDQGRYVCGEWLRGHAFRGQLRARDQRGGRFLVTFTSDQVRPLAETQAKLAWEGTALAPLCYLGALATETSPEGAVLVEAEPAGAPASSALSTEEALASATGLGQALATAHARGHVIAAIRPELVYLDGPFGQRRYAGTAPRAERFFSTASPLSHGVSPPPFATIYAPPEVLALSPQIGAAADVFALAATLVFWLTGQSPFEGDDLMAQFSAATLDTRRPHQLPSALGALVDRCLSPDPGARPSLEHMLSALSAMTAVKPVIGAQER